MSKTKATKADSELQCAETKARFEEIDQFVESLVNRTVFRLGALMVLIGLTLLAVAPFYIQGVLCLMDSQ
ncbi:MAG: hypothetical protein OXG54_13025 [Gammaproteobacteria bacterium]|nr:hypothetical protein [Gammaproteobacteria bacterium]